MKKWVNPVTPLEIVFCGNSLYLSALAAGLQGRQTLRVRSVNMPPKQAMLELAMLRPDAVIIEAGHGSPDLLPRLWRRSGICRVVVVVQPDTDTLAVFGGGRRVTAPVDRLAQTIEQTVAGARGRNEEITKG